MKGGIPIASSYKIIKRHQPQSPVETRISPIDLKTYQPTERISYKRDEENSFSEEEALRTRLKAEMEEELQEKIDQMRAQAQDEIEGLKEAAREEGLAQGLEEGIEMGRQQIYKELETLRQDAVNKVQEAEQEAKSYLDENEERILGLSMKIAEKIIHVTLEQHKESLMLLARPILEEYGKTEKVIINCHPEKVNFIKEHLPEMEKLCPSARILVLEDHKLKNHDLIIENENQITDLTISRQIERFLELAMG